MNLKEERVFGIARKIVANMTTESIETIPHGIVSYEADVTEMMPIFKEINAGASKEEKISINTIMMKIICEGLKAAPMFNSHMHFHRKLVRGKILIFDNIDISMPVILPSGEMMTVNMHDMGEKSLSEMTKSINDTLRRAANSDMNEVMFEVSLDNTLQGLKKGKFKQTFTRLYGSKMPGKHQVKTLSGDAKKEYYKIPQSHGNGLF